jgi:hypothetical protein
MIACGSCTCWYMPSSAPSEVTRLFKSKNASFGNFNEYINNLKRGISA